jgi:dextranase
MVKVTLENGSTKVTAIDVSSDVSRYPRYGYSVDFPEGETEAQSTALMTELARDYHINLVQYFSLQHSYIVDRYVWQCNFEKQHSAKDQRRA